tara:strand:- start:5647 stop:6012 length:366 start_codon:yes stop_codon:yes gene_type:complete
MGLWADGTFYWIELPIPIVKVKASNPGMGFYREAVVEVTRNALKPMQGLCTYQISCDSIVENLEATNCALEPGKKTFQYTLPIPMERRGDCYYSGIVSYRPFGLLGPALEHYWETEHFTIP